ncbi:hypothetical protein ACDI16_12435 [Oceanobacillus caeni]
MTTGQSNSVHNQNAMWGATQGTQPTTGGPIEVTDVYRTYNPETNEYTNHSYSQDEFNGLLEDLSKSNRSLVREFNKLNELEYQSIFNEFQEEAERIIEEVQGLEGELYTQEGKNAEIKKRLKELADQKKSEADNMQQSYTDRHNELLENVERELNKSESLTSEEIAAINLRNSELQGQIRGKLYRLNDTRSLEYEFQTMVTNSKHDKGLARFLENNYYLFLDKINQLDTSEMDKERAIHRIQTMAKELTESNYSKKERALHAVKSQLSNKAYRTQDKRLIDLHLKQYLNKY